MADHYVHRLQVSMPLSIAEKIADAAFKAGADAKLLPLTIAVLDTGGNIVLLKRQDGSGNLRADIAIGKAAGALGMAPSSTATIVSSGWNVAYASIWSAPRSGCM